MTMTIVTDILIYQSPDIFVVSSENENVHTNIVLNGKYLQKCNFGEISTNSGPYILFA